MFRKNILFVVNSLGIGGLETVVRDLVLNINKKKFRPVICCLTKKGIIAEDLEKRGFKVYELNKKPGLGLNLPFKIRKIIKKERINIIHTNNTDALHQGILASLFIKKFFRVHTDHNSFAECQKRRVLIFNKILSFFIYKIVLVSDRLRKDWIKFIGNKNKIIVIHNGIDIKKFNLSLNISNEKRKLGIKANEKIIGCVARLSEEKDHITLLNAFDKVNKTIKNSKLLIIGDGPLKNNLKEYSKKLSCNKDVLFLGNRKDAPNILKVMDLFALSSLSEGCSQSIKEAMAAGLPVIATNVGGNPELVVENKTGILVPKKNPQLLAEAIIKLLNDKKLREKMGEEGRKRVEKYFTIEKMVKEYDKVYNKQP